MWGDIPEWALAAAQSIMQSVNLKDPETFYHCLRVGKGSRLLAQAAGLNEYEQNVLEFAGMFHDVGKIGVPDEILLKPAKLTEEEYKIMQSHPEKSVQIIQPLTHHPFFKSLLPGVLHHHERIDGKGYPYNLKGDDIPLAARIVLIADTFDAITAARSYRAGRPAEVARKELHDCAGTQFDTQLVDVFLKAQPFWLKRTERTVTEELSAQIANANQNTRKAA
jgi:HD-GYP domain-containing protein (c-di-GMP phosphodiesterase class II)